jgi:hypothetical protein
MSPFHIGLIVGFFLGALTMFVAIGVIVLYLAERRNAEPVQDDSARWERIRGEMK